MDNTIYSEHKHIIIIIINDLCRINYRINYYTYLDLVYFLLRVVVVLSILIMWIIQND